VIKEINGDKSKKTKVKKYKHMNIDERFETELNKVDSLKWLPWIGKNYNETKIFILGESQYEDGDDWQDENNLATRILIQKGFTDGFGKIQKIATKTLLAKLSPSDEERNYVWESVIYHNLTQRLMSSIEERPSEEDFDNGWKVFLELAEVTRPNTCIVLGKSTIGRLGYYLNNNDTGWERNVSEFYESEKIINLSKDNYKLKLIFINHPTGSHGFDYEYWADLIDRNDSDLRTKLTKSEG
jgi:hypothetical protein